MPLADLDTAAQYVVPRVPVSTRGTTDTRRTSVLVAGTPVAGFELTRLPSVNDYIAEINRHRAKGSAFEKQWRTFGHKTVEGWAAAQGLALKPARRADGTMGVGLKSPVISSGILVVYKVWKGSRQTKDSSFNLYTKPFEDGLTDAGFWPGDDDRYVVAKLPVYCGVAPTSRIAVEVHHVAGRVEGNEYGVHLYLDAEEVEGILRRTAAPDSLYADDAPFRETAIALVGEDPRTAPAPRRRARKGRGEGGFQFCGAGRTRRRS